MYVLSGRYDLFCCTNDTLCQSKQKVEKFDDIALDCKDFQTDDIYTCVLGNEIVDVHRKYVPYSM